ncbi:hypothetical protein D9M69_507130 [compost metagenome]
MINGLLDQGDNFLIDCIQTCFIQLAGRQHTVTEVLQAIVLVAVALHFILGPVVLRVAFEVPEVTNGGAVDGRRATAIARQLKGLAHGLIHREEVEAICLPHRDAEAFDTFDDVIATDAVGGAGVFAVAVVFEHENLRHLEDDSHVHGLEHSALVGSAVTGKGSGYVSLPSVLAGNGRTDRDGLASTYHAIGAEHALGDIGDVHRAALAAIEAVPAAVDFFHHAFDIAALGDAMSVASMGTDDVVLIGQMLARAYCHSFLPAVQVSETGNGAGGVLHMHAFFELADHFHLPIGFQ